MNNAYDVLNDFRDSNSNSAYSGAYEALELIRLGKKHLLYPLYQKVCDYGDWGRAGGVQEMAKAYGYEGFLKNPQPKIHFEAEDTLGEAWVLNELIESPKEKMVLFYQLTEGRYKVIVELDCLEDGEYSFVAEDHTGGYIDHGDGYHSGEEAVFRVNEWEEGIVKITITALSSKLTKYIVDND